MIFTKYDNQYGTVNKIVTNTKIGFDELKILFNSNKSETDKANILFNSYYTQKPIGYLDRKVSGVEESADVKIKRKQKENYVKFKMSSFPFVNFNCTMYDGKIHDKINIEDYSGYMILDYDELTTQEIFDLKNIFMKSPYVSLVFGSPSGNGIKVLVKINKLERLKHDDNYFNEYFNFVKEYFENEIKKILNKELITDISGKNVNRGCYIPFDSTFYYNPKAKNLSYTKKSVEIIKQQTKQQSTIQSDSEATREEMNLLVKFIDIIHDNKLPVADNYDTWIRIGFCIKRYMKNIASGKELFNKASKYSSGYKSVQECDKKYEELVNGTSTKEVSIKYLDNLIKDKTTFQVYLDKEEKLTLKSNGNYTLVDIHKLMKQDKFIIIENLINHNIIISWDGQEEMNISKIGDKASAIFRKHFLLNYNLDISRKADFIYAIYNYDIQYINPSVEMMKHYSLKYTSGLTENFENMCSLIPTDDILLDDKIKLLKHYLLSVVNNLTYERGTGRKCDEILIFNSEDGSYGKTEFIRNILFKPIMLWKDQLMYKESGNFNSNNKDVMYQDLSTVINYKPEISKDLTRNSNAIKQYLSIETFTMRRPYRADEEEFLSRTSFIGDTNDRYYLPNDSNLRRFLVLTITAPLQFKIKVGKKWKESGGVNFEMIWAYMYNLHMSGETYDTVDIPIIFKDNVDQIATDYDDAIIKKVVRPAINNSDYFSIDQLLVELKNNNLNLKDTSQESIRVKLKNMGLKCEMKWNKILKKNTRSFYSGIINCLDVKQDEINPYENRQLGIRYDDFNVDKLSDIELNKELKHSISKEAFELASKIRDEIKRRNV